MFAVWIAYNFLLNKVNLRAETRFCCVDTVNMGHAKRNLAHIYYLKDNSSETNSKPCIFVKIFQIHSMSWKNLRHDYISTQLIGEVFKHIDSKSSAVWNILSALIASEITKNFQLSRKHVVNQLWLVRDKFTSQLHYIQFPLKRPLFRFWNLTNMIIKLKNYLDQGNNICTLRLWCIGTQYFRHFHFILSYNGWQSSEIIL